MERSIDGFGGGGPADLKGDLQHIQDVSLAIKADRNYWFIRTDGGFYYRLFVEKGIVAIGYTKIQVPEPADGTTKKSILGDVLEQVRKRHPEAKRPGQIAKQVMTFTNLIQAGDVVIIPGVNSTVLSFGIVVDDLVEDAVIREGDDAFELRTRKVHWVKSIPKRALNPYLYSMFFAHQTISNGNEYGKYIDNTLSDFFVKDGKAHLQLQVEKSDDINARALFQACLDLLNLTDDCLQYVGLPERTDNVEVKVNINSPGTVDFMAHSFNAIAVLGILIFAVTGANFSLKIGGSVVEFKTEGLISKVREFLAQRSKNQALDAMVKELQSLEMKSPKDIVEVIKKVVK
ncbi:hypothetical protein [Geomonas agri]|uniref:hypothetical protein n=1 Tax=Geomonas agri TaxID=2873702 RepID=UPI001CD5171A|nr:hypothetical protein [Geomonas agri]